MSALEEVFWERIKIICDHHKFPHPEREFRFAQSIGRQWRFDFAWPAQKFAVEVDGGTGMRISRHTSVAGYREDCMKLNSALIMRWSVLRGDQAMVANGHLALMAEDFMLNRGEPSLRRTRNKGPYLPVAVTSRML